MGFFYGLNREDYDREYSDRELLKRIYTYFVPHGKRVVAIALLTVALSTMNVVPRIVIAQELDSLILDPQRLDALLIMVGVVRKLGASLYSCAGNWSNDTDASARCFCG